MPKNKCLVIVESPSKAKTIGKYLGPDYIVKASMGHLRDLPRSKMGVDIDNDFNPEYINDRTKSKLIKELKQTSESCDSVLLATDPDREGEAISWHLKTILGLQDDGAYRVTFPEITKNVVLSSIKNPRAIDMNLVDAQQARRVLDRIVGYKLSPVLWKKISGGPRGLSAGRVQSVAVKLVVDRENEIRQFIPEEYWNVEAEIERLNGDVYSAKYYGEEKKRTLTSQTDAESVLKDVQNGTFTVRDIKRSPKKKYAPPPFTTSSLQQAASSRLGMSPKRTMALAQQLYEGIDITGLGAVGLITYMRTDSVRLSDEAMGAAKNFITEKMGPSYYYGSYHRYKTGAGAQDGHEAIRPTDVNLTPERVSKDLNRDQLRLYRLIWTRFVATQMAPAVLDTLSFDSVCCSHVFRSSFQTVSFKGFTAVYDDSEPDEENKPVLEGLTEGECCKAKNTAASQHFTQPPARYTEASLVKAMEENGVGRPSTYASIISTIEEKQYVEKKEKHLIPTAVGETVNSFLEDHFRDIVDVGFTANMEKKLDDVESGAIFWKQVLRDFYNDFSDEVDASGSTERYKVKTETLNENCPECGKPLLIRIGRFGRFIACSGYPSCKYTRAIVEPMPGRCPKCGAGMVKKKSGNGVTYYACETGNDCFMTWDIPLENDCPECGASLFKRSGRGSSTPFCVNPSCPAFLPEDKRGYFKKKAAASEKKKTAVSGSAKTAKTSRAKTTNKKTAAGTQKKKSSAGKSKS